MNFYKQYKQIVIAMNTAWMMFSLVFTVYLNSVCADELSPSKTSFIKIAKSENTISVNLLNADLSDVARMLSKQAEIKVFLDENLSRKTASKITSKFNDMPIEMGIKRLLGPAVSSAFVFSKEKSESGKEQYRLDSVKIFESGNMFSANFREIDSRLTEAGEPSPTVRISDSAAQKALPQSPETLKYEIMLARENLNVIRRKGRTDLARINERIAGLKMQLSRKPSPQERAELSDKMSRAENELMMLKALNNTMILDEEKNIRELLGASSKAESQKKFTLMMRDAERQRKKLRIEN